MRETNVNSFYTQGFYGIMDEKNGRLYAESGPEREVCAMTMKCPNCGAEFSMEERYARTARPRSSKRGGRKR